MASQSQDDGQNALPPVNIKPLLTKLWPNESAVSPQEIAEAISHFFTNQVTEAQTASLLMALHFTKLDFRADVLAECARVMREAAASIPVEELKEVIERRGRKEGDYNGGLCDIVGTGGDGHDTFNISTTSSILASALLMVSKHGNKASTSKSGSADLVACMKPQPPIISAIRPDTLVKAYSETNYTFLFAPVFHTGMRYVAPIRKQLPWRTVFNNLGPLANPVEDVLEARVIGVGRRDLGPAFAEALCAGNTLCWRVNETSAGRLEVEHFTVHPSDFGLSTHPLDTVSSGKEPSENAEILSRILHNELPDDDPILEFVLLNTAALLVTSGICESDTSNMGEGDDGKVITERGPGGQRWKEGIRRARWALKSGEAWRQWEKFVKVTNEIGA
ncbi:Glycosyl transferase family 3, N-terminal domain [Fusarium oxysporum f. sp. vasinfectum]|nr:Glycosyl transferase family 3, N-terminal domain [Fusarium oxysporum f. sp. vasinfectum]WKT39158.1 Glycosyl transferase family 3, N-terminal domain [Fusarium oxysporum f. sp. vasinfectum]